ncbi:MAG: outer membrane lipoprotein-sorting protein [Fibrobacteria bacterium]
MSILLLCAAGFIHGATEDDLARPLLLQALENQYHGRYQANLQMINENFADGKDSLSGWAEFADDVGERKISLSGPAKAFEYKSLNFGKEQWITDDNSRRVRRIANRQWKKGVFGNLLTYEDMLKLPADFFLEYSSCKSVKVTDSAYQISMTLKPLFQSFYSRIDVTLSKTPVLVKGMVFFGGHGERLKSLEVKGYQEMEGKWLVTNMCVADNDSTASLQMCFKNFSFTESPLAQSQKIKAGLVANRPLLVPAPAGNAGELERENPEDVSN